VNIGTLFYLLPIVGVLTGFAAIRYRRVPWLAAGAVLGVFVLYVASAGIWAATCWDCDVGASDTRADILYLSAVFFAIVTAVSLAGIALGARLATMLGRLSRTIRELRGRDADA
jgi:hypothetical protein